MARPPLVVLLPPSEGKAPGGAGPAWAPAAGRFGARLADARAEVAAALSRVGGGDERLLGVGGRHLERAVAANRSLVGAPTTTAAQRYRGVVFDHVDVATLGPAARRRAARSVVVVSGLLGLVALDDPVPDYRLKMGARLAPFGVLARWWRPRLSPVLAEHLRGAVVVDLLPAEHAAAWDRAAATWRVLYRVRFVERSGRAAGHDAKAAKGLLVRELLGTDRRAAASLEAFTHERFTLEVTEG